uniref:Putative receptor-mediated endocytosis n=1 Tax=Rhipicephalus pulchellus TaxID=72859 RepID=L7M4W4_RHIPC
MTNADVENVSADGVSALETKIITQVEYYFGDYNLPRDKFLQGKLKEDDGWVTIGTLLTFNRLRSLTTESDVVAAALRKSTSQLLEVSEDGTKIRRSPAKPAPESNKEQQQKLDELSVYVKGFPPTATIDELLEFFGRFGKCINVFMRRYPKSRKFKGSVFATFATKEEADAFLAKEDVKYNELELTRALKTEYVARKKQERQARFEEKAKKKAANDEASSGGGGDAAEESEPPEIVLGCILRVKGLGDKTTWENLKEAFAPYAKVAFVDYTRGQPEAVLRFAEEGSAQAVLAKLGAQEEALKINGDEVTAEAVEGDEEVEYWKKLTAAKRDKKNRFKAGQRGNRGGHQGRGRGQGGRRQDRGKKRSSDDAAGAGGDKTENSEGKEQKKDAQENNEADKGAESEAKRSKTDDGVAAAE